MHARQLYLDVAYALGITLWWIDNDDHLFVESFAVHVSDHSALTRLWLCASKCGRGEWHKWKTIMPSRHRQSHNNTKANNLNKFKIGKKANSGSSVVPCALCIDSNSFSFHFFFTFSSLCFTSIHFDLASMWYRKCENSMHENTFVRSFVSFGECVYVRGKAHIVDNSPCRVWVQPI